MFENTSYNHESHQNNQDQRRSSHPVILFSANPSQSRIQMNSSPAKLDFLQQADGHRLSDGTDFCLHPTDFQNRNISGCEVMSTDNGAHRLTDSAFAPLGWETTRKSGESQQEFKGGGDRSKLGQKRHSYGFVVPPPHIIKFFLQKNEENQPKKFQSH